jgi:YesN/AraC family two-component response regulator
MNHLKRLLIVDDEETLTYSLYQTFINAPVDCEVVTAASGEEALKRFAEKSFDLVITDLEMPGIKGLELLSRVKSQKTNTQVIIITAYGSDEKEEQAYELGADYYLEKPFDIWEIKNLVLKMLE